MVYLMRNRAIKHATYVEVKGTHLYIKPYPKPDVLLISCSKRLEIVESLRALKKERSFGRKLKGISKSY